MTVPSLMLSQNSTFFSSQEGESYLSLVTDAYSRKIVGYHVDDNLKTASVKRAFMNTLKSRQSDSALIHHSDRGILYCSRKYQQVHKQHGVRCSMTEGYDCYQNALAERVNRALKMEYLVMKPDNLAEARKIVAESVKLYNQKRPHTALEYKTPDKVHQAFTG